MKNLKLLIYSISLVALTYLISFSFITFQIQKEINNCFDNIEKISSTEKHNLFSTATIDEKNNFVLQIDNFSDCFTVKSIEYKVIGFKNTKIDTIQFYFYENILPGQTLKTLINEIKIDSIKKLEFELIKVNI